MFTENEIRKVNGYSVIVYIDEIPKLSKREAKKISSAEGVPIIMSSSPPPASSKEKTTYKFILVGGRKNWNTFRKLAG